MQHCVCDGTRQTGAASPILKSCWGRSAEGNRRLSVLSGEGQRSVGRAAPSGQAGNLRPLVGDEEAAPTTVISPGGG